MVEEIATMAPQTRERSVSSVFFGGGTPSLMDPALVNAIIERIRQNWPMVNDPEISLEANPTSVEAGRFAGYRDAGVNRISMGIQALNDTDLRRLGRMHSVKDAKAAFDTARNLFDRVSFDLIYARQDQTLEDWKAELTEALNMAIDHLSLYQLTIEEGTAFGDRYARGKLRDLPTDDTAADMYQATQEICAAHGMPAYEISNHARPGEESRHNQIYWRYGDYLGIGPGAHGRVTHNGQRYATETHRAPGAWLKAVADGSGESLCQALPREDTAIEYMMMSMRLAEGMNIPRYTALSGQALPQDRVDDLVNLGMVTTSDQVIRATDQGRAVLNAVLRELLVD